MTTTPSYQLSIAAIKPTGAFACRAKTYKSKPPGQKSRLRTPSWPYVKGNVLTFSRPKRPGDGAPWHCRVSEHTKEDATFEEFWSKLGVNKAHNEKEFIGAIKKVAQVRHISPTQSIWTLYYTFPPPVSPRVFTVLQTTHLDESLPRTGIIVSIPIDLSEDEELSKIEEKATRGRYVSVERLLELENGRVEWRMATSSTPGGNIPSFISEGSMPSQISADVPHFLKWFHTIREEQAGN